RLYNTTLSITRKLSFFGQPPKCGVAHTFLPIPPSKVRHTDIYLSPAGDHGTKSKTNYARTWRRNGVDERGGHDVGVGCAEHVPDLPPSAFAFVLRPSASSPARIERRAGSVQNLSHFRLAERQPALAHAVMAPLICWSFSNSMF